MMKHLPNFITCLNAFAGCIASVIVFNAENINDLQPVMYLLILAGLFDFADGLFARALKAYSNIGKDLDSLADAISFGFVPGAIMYKLLLFTLPQDLQILAYSGFVITIFSILRLAIFNNDTRQTDQFIGVPTPINALMAGSLSFIFVSFPYILEFFNDNWWWLFVYILICSYLLVSEIHLIALKFKTLKWADNKTRFIFIILCLLLVVFLNMASVPLIFLSYLIISIIDNKIAI
jgi:CDP-diacylglycerol--serine O-phosphatidyltransferase